MNALIGKQIDRYRIVEQLGMGGMATVFKAFDTRLERHVAIKLIRAGMADENFLKRFEREAKALGQMDHPNIVKVLDYGDYEGLPYLVMVYLSGGTLKKMLGSPMPYDQAARLLLPIAQALDYAHQMKIIHRDVKPANILLTSNGLPMLSDFGIAKLIEEGASLHLTSTGMGIGTPEYMAPEQWLGNVVLQTDIYALGVVFYEMVTGRRPYMADTPAAILLKLTNEPLPRPSQFVSYLPESVENTLYKALAKRPEDRFASMAKFASVLANLAQGIEPDVQVSYERTQLYSRPAKTEPPAAASATAKALVETAQALESQGNAGGALELYRRAATMAAADGVLQWQIRQAIQRLEKMIAPAPPPSPPTHPSQETPSSVRTAPAVPTEKPKRWGWLWAVAGVSLLALITLAVLAVIGISSLIKSQNETPIAEVRPTHTSKPESTATITPLPTMPRTPAVEATPIGNSSPTLQPLPTLTMPLQSLVNQNCGEGDLIRSIEAVDTLTVKFTLCQTDPAFLHKLSLPFVGIQPADYIIQTQGQGDFFDKPIGTGPYKVLAWSRQESITLQQFAGYHGQPPHEAIITILFQDDDATRIKQIAAGEADLAPSISPSYLAEVENNPTLVLLSYPYPLISYIGMNNQYAPFNDVRFRKALAMGIDRDKIVLESYPPGYTVSPYLNACSIPSACEGEPWYDFDPAAAKALLEEAGYSQGIKIKIYIRDVSRMYLPNPQDTATILQEQLKTNLGIQADVFYLDQSDFFTQLVNGTMDGLYILGWTSDYLHPYDLLNELFVGVTPYLGDPYAEINKLMQTAKNDPFNTVIYAQINNQIQADVPLIPLATGNQNHLALRGLNDITLTPLGTFYLNRMSNGKGEIRLLLSHEPVHLYCGVDDSISYCSQVVEGLMGYDSEGNVIPVLAERWESSGFGMEWTFHLQPGVLFHNGKTLDANDVVMTFTALIDASSPYHDTSGDVYYSAEYLFGLVND